MDIGIIGLPKSGKTTLFNALTRGKAEVGRFGVGGQKANVGVTKVPDPRLGVLASMFHPQRVVPAEIRFVDIPGAPKDLGRGEGIEGEYLNLLERADALFHVVRAFDDPAIPFPNDVMDPYRNLETLTMELTFADLAIVEKRLQRLEASFKGAKATERTSLQREQGLLLRLKECLEKEQPLRGESFTPEEAAILKNYQFLTWKPMLVVFNLGEGDIPREAFIEDETRSRVDGFDVRSTVACGKLEMELCQMGPEDERVFRESMGLRESGVERIIRLAYRLLGYVSFLTVGPDEVRAWSVGQGTNAVKAAGKIHSDIERGFIRAEVVSYDDLVDCGGMVEARKRGLLRQEGKVYEVKDGDVINFLFNV